MEENERPMDEFEWEEFLKKNDEMVKKYSALMEKYMDDPNCDEIIAKEMGWNIDGADDGIERPWLDEMNEAIEEMQEAEEGDEWKTAAGIDDEEGSGISDFDKDPLYVLGFSFAVDTIQWCETLSEEVKADPDMDMVMQNCLLPAAKIAGGLSTNDDDKDLLGLRLANYKRGLSAANKTLNGLSAVSAKGLIAPEKIFPIIKRATELRNALAVRIVELRDRFNTL